MLGAGAPDAARAAGYKRSFTQHSRLPITIHYNYASFRRKKQDIMHILCIYSAAAAILIFFENLQLVITKI
jgi:hypothetical protein